MPLHAAIRAADLPAASELLRSGADPNRRDPSGLTPLMIASGLGQPYMVSMLLDAGADVLALDPRMGATALHKAAQSGNADVIGFLLDKGAFVDQQSPVLGNTALIDAVLHRQASAVALLLDRGARPAIRNHWGQSALDIARADDVADIARLIEARIASDAERVGELALVAAVKAADRFEVERLVAAGANLDEQVPLVGSLDDRYTPLGIAAREGRLEIARLLLDAGADPTRMIGLMGGTALHDATYFGHADIVRLLAEPRRGARPLPELDAQGAYNGLSALHDAVWQGHIDTVRALCDAGARRDLRGHTGLTPRELALHYGADDIAQLLAEKEREPAPTRTDHPRGDPPC
ncbi:ankyrin repeat domain-containing protein [Massilia timonae]|uniref:ankyrin repeat domain-containing protein n=1 Tax=Massilia timonae TaxID=47229 RepID=UPI0028D18D51|nr:ankyrin repeat domain-containing protein [Massilia timonae]